MKNPLEIAIGLEGLSQAELGRRTGYRRETINRLLHGRHFPSGEMRKRIASALGRPAKELFPEESPR